MNCYFRPFLLFFHIYKYQRVVNMQLVLLVIMELVLLIIMQSNVVISFLFLCI